MVVLRHLGTVIGFILPSQIPGTVSIEAENRSNGGFKILASNLSLLTLWASYFFFVVVPKTSWVEMFLSLELELESLYYLWLRDPDSENPEMEGMQIISNRTKKGGGISIFFFFSRKN